MSTSAPEYIDDCENPLDGMEQVLADHQWSFERPNPEELNVSVRARLGLYHMHFVWQDDDSALQFFCAIDGLAIPEERMADAYRLLSTINNALWLGHFDFSADTTSPVFRHTVLYRGAAAPTGVEPIGELMDIALAECERVFPAFEQLCRMDEAAPDTRSLDFALMTTAGQA